MEWVRDQDDYDLMTRCQAAGVPAGVVQTGKDLAERDPQIAASGFMAQIADPLPDFGQTYADKLPLKFHGTPCEDYQRVRAVGEDNQAVLRDWLGMSDADIAAADENGYLS